MIYLENDPAIAKRNAGISFLLFALGGVVGLRNMFETLPFGDGFEMVMVARNLAYHGAYANPFLALPTGPTAVCPPLYPFLLALAIKLLRLPSLVILAAAVGNVFANALTAAWLPRVSWLIFGRTAPGVVASVLWLLAAQLMPSWDAGYTAAALLLFCLYSARSVGEGKRIRRDNLTGLLAGALLLLNPVSALVFFPWLVYLLAEHRAAWKRAVTYFCTVMGIATLVVIPWMARNEVVLGGFVVRSCFGLNLYLSNNDCSGTSLMDDLHSGCAARYQPNYSVAEAQKMRDLGELKYDHLRLDDAEVWMQAHPKRFSQLTQARIAAFWFPRRVEHPFQAGVIWGATILSIPGLILMAWRRERVVYFMLFVLLIYPLMYYTVFSDVRFRYPVLWLSLLPAGYFVAWLWRQSVLQAAGKLGIAGWMGRSSLGG